MAIDPTALRSRRALLAGALGGLGAIVAGALGRPLRVEADGETVVIGNSYTGITKVTSIQGTSSILECHTTVGDAVVGSSDSGRGIRGYTNTGKAVSGLAFGEQGVYAVSI